MVSRTRHSTRRKSSKRRKRKNLDTGFRERAAHRTHRQAGIHCHKWRCYAAERLTLRPWPLPRPSRPGLLLLLLLLLPARCRRATRHDHVELGVGEEGPRARPAAVGERDAREAHAVQLDHVEPAGSAHAPDLPVPTLLEHEPQPRLPSAGLGWSRPVSAGLPSPEQGGVAARRLGGRGIPLHHAGPRPCGERLGAAV